MIGEEKRSPVLSADIYNVVDIFRIQERLAAERGLEVAPRADYAPMLQAVAEWRSAFGLAPASASIALIAVDTRSDKQTRFAEALSRLGMRVEAIDYRWTYAGTVEERNAEPERSISTLAPTVSYLLGLLAGRAEALGAKAEVVVVGGVFDICRSMLDFVQNRRGAAVLSFPKGMLDRRWNWVGLGGPECPIAFANMDPVMPRIFGVDAAPAWREAGRSSAVGGIAGI